MRAGCFAETRVIELLNRRFVSFYYNTGGPGLGKDRAAAAFTKGKTKNVWAFYAAFGAGGEPLGVTDIYADKDNVFDFLVAILRKYPEFDRFTQEEERLLARARAEPDNAAARLEAGRLLEDLGRYGEAEPHFLGVIQAGAASDLVAEAYRACMRMARYRRDWEGLHALLRKIEGLLPDHARALNLGADTAMEKGFLLLDRKQYAEARQVLEAAVRAYPDSMRQSELRFNAGVACFFLKDKEHAYRHWCWVVENLPDDRLARRCFIAAAHEGMPYPNPELGGYAAPL